MKSVNYWIIITELLYIWILLQVKTTKELLEQIQSRGSGKAPSRPLSPHSPGSPHSPDVMLIEPDCTLTWYLFLFKCLCLCGFGIWRRISSSTIIHKCQIYACSSNLLNLEMWYKSFDQNFKKLAWLGSRAVFKKQCCFKGLNCEKVPQHGVLTTGGLGFNLPPGEHYFFIYF